MAQEFNRTFAPGQRRYDKGRTFSKGNRIFGVVGKVPSCQSEYGTARDSYDKLLQSAEKTRDADNLFVAYTGLGWLVKAWRIIQLLPSISEKP